MSDGPRFPGVPTLLVVAACLAAPPAQAQDAARGEQLYRALPGTPGVGSCISCHGDPINNRNSVLRGAAGAALISRTIAAVGAMGFLRQHLGDADLADIAAYLGTVVPGGALESLPDPWPTVDDFGVQAVGTQAVERVVWLRNLQARVEVPLGVVVSSDGLAFPVQHECPLSLPPLAQCRIRTWFRPQGEGPAEARIDIQGSGGQLLRSVRLVGRGAALQPPQLAWDAPSMLIDFGRVEVGDSAVQRVHLVNASSQPVALRRLRITGPQALRYSLSAPCAAAGQLAPAERCEVTLTHTPRSPERSEGWVELDADAAHPPLLRVQALGVAPDAGAAEPDPAASAPAAPSVAEEGTGGGLVSPLGLLALAAAARRLSRRR